MMRRIVTTCLLTVLLAGTALTATAQDREDVIWARDIGNATITLDGVLDEAAWADAEVIELEWGERAGLPGSGWRIHGSFQAAGPTDPPRATIKLLRKGNQLYIGAEVEDKSVGGSGGLWNIDGLVIAINNRKAYEDAISATPLPKSNFTGFGEYFYSWWHAADTTASGDPTPGTDPRFHGLFGSPGNVASKEREAERVAAWDAVTVVDGVSNDDTHGDDNGYTIEMRMDLSAVGYDLSLNTTAVPMSFTIYDSDYQWPIDPERFITTKVWFQNQWGNNLNDGAALVMTSPNVTLSTSTLPQVDPDILVLDGSNHDAPTIDGKLDESVWQTLTPAISFGYQQIEVNRRLPGYGPWLTQWWEGPDLNGAEPNPDVVDPSLIHLAFFHRDDKLYIGATVEDQAINGQIGETGDGFSITLNHIDTFTADNAMAQMRFTFNIDSTGNARLSDYAGALAAENPDAIQAAASVIGNSTIADPSDVDEGYQIEIMIDLAALGYPAGLGDQRLLWIGANVFDADYFEDPNSNYNNRTWWLRERTTGPGAVAFLSSDAVTSIDDDVAALPQRIELEGNYPNPFGAGTMLRYRLPESGTVTIRIFDVLGREVATLAQGVQSAGKQELRFDASGLASGVYLYQVELNASTGHLQTSAQGRMTLVK